jgi:hypothetical protein
LNNLAVIFYNFVDFSKNVILSMVMSIYSITFGDLDKSIVPCIISFYF